jgi:DNA-binding CsgD family transcriptional regulator
MASTNPLSRREQEVAELLLQGKSNKQIAAMLGISESTVEFHLKNIYAKLQVSSRAEAILKLGKSTGVFGGKLGESAVDGMEQSAHNEITEEPTPAISELPEARTGSSLRKAGKFLWRYKVLLLIGIVLAVIAGFVLKRPVAWDGYEWDGYERECENPDEASVGQMIERVNASGAQVHGQFGTMGGPPWPAVPGYVAYKNIRIPRVDRLYLIFRYSKNSPATTPILISLDDEPFPRASIYLLDLQNWEQFAWTVPIDLGVVSGGVHSITFSTEGQPYGVADLDQLILTDSLP